MNETLITISDTVRKVDEDDGGDAWNFAAEIYVISIRQKHPFWSFMKIILLFTIFLADSITKF